MVVYICSILPIGTYSKYVIFILDCSVKSYNLQHLKPYTLFNIIYRIYEYISRNLTGYSYVSLYCFSVFYRN